MSNFGLYKAFDEQGIGYAKTAVGDKYVYEYMAKNGCRIGGEQSGHIIFSKRDLNNGRDKPMCGIVGFTGKRQAAPILLDGLSKLEYRGYDSAGLAVRDGEALAEVVKAKGRLKRIWSSENRCG